MKSKTLLIAGAATALMAIACDKGTSITSPDLATTQPKFAIVTQDFPWSRDEPNPCNGDVVSTTGSSHIVFGSTLDNSGGTHLTFSISSRGSGVGAPSLMPYTINDQTSESDQDPDGPQVTDHFEERLLVSAPKSALNYIRHTVFKITVNADGVPTALFDNTWTKCAGDVGVAI